MLPKVIAAALVLVIHPLIHITLPFVDILFHILPLVILGVPKK